MENQIQEKLNNSFKSSFPIFLDFYTFIIISQNFNRITDQLRQRCSLLAETIILHEDFVFNLNNCAEIIKETKSFFLQKMLSLQDEKSKKSTNPKEIKKEMTENPGIEKMSLETLINLYISTFKTFFPELLPYFSNSKIGLIQIKYPRSFSSWKNRLVVLDTIKKKILIFKETKLNDPEKEINLENYVIRWVGQKRERIVFCLDVFTKNIGKVKIPKSILFGDESERIIKEWYEKIRLLMGNEEKSIDKIINQKQKIPINRLSDLSEGESDGKYSKDRGYYSEIGCPSPKSTKKISEKKEPNSDSSDSTSSFKDLEESMKPLRKKNEEIKIEGKYPTVIEQLFESLKRENLMDETDYRLAWTKGNVRILNHQTDQNNFKLFLNLRHEPGAILRCFLDESYYRNWNSTVKEFKVVQILTPFKSMIIHEKRDYHLSLYNKREFYFLRSVVTDWSDNKFALIDKSIDSENINETSEFWETKGSIHFNIICILPHNEKPKNSLLVVTTQIDNNGALLTDSQNSELILKYLQDFEHLDTFLSQRSFFDNDLSSILLKYPFLKEETILNNESHCIFDREFAKSELISSNILEKIEEYKQEDIQKFQINNKENQNINDTRIHLDKEDYKYMLELVSSNEYIIRSIQNKYTTNTRNETVSKFQLIHPIDGHYALNKDWSIAKNGGLLWFNKQEMEVQSKVLTYLIGQLGSNLIQGKSVVNISLPVDIFDTKSFLERIANSYTYAPYFLKIDKNEGLNTPLDNLKKCIIFLISTLHMGIMQKKPFNPILGETYQAWIDGSPIYLEQISHHPPVSAFIMYGKGYKIEGSFEMTAAMSVNSVVGRQIGYGKIIFDKIIEGLNQTIYFTIPACVVNGMSFGQRIVTYEGKCFVFDLKNRLFCEMSFNPDKKGIFKSFLSKQATGNDFFRGNIYKCTENFCDKIEKNLTQKKINKFDGINPDKDSKEIIGNIEGIWHDYLEIDGIKVWELKKFIAYQLEEEEYPLPSDCCFRQDLIIWRSKDIKAAQLTKEKMEEVQRADKKNREKINKGKKNHH